MTVTSFVEDSSVVGSSGGLGRGGVGGSYRPFLDGLRAVAVYLVVLFHGGADRFSGGFVGVDVFFVLSGFLVTQLLLRDVVAVGSVRFGRFYARRFRRLLPAAFVVLVVTALVFAALGSPVEVADASGGFKAAFLYVTNWYFIDQSADYFGADLSTNPVLHFWSLAVEEQFYLVWPVVLGGLWALTRRFGVRQRQVVRAVVAVGAVVSLWWAWSLRGSDPGRGYYGTDARAYQLMAGALLALAPGLFVRARRFAGSLGWVAVGAAVGLVVVASSTADRLDPIERGMAVTVVTVVLLVALEAGEGGPLRWVLSLPPVVYLGKISYGTYLWHWPIALVLVRTFDLSTVSTIAWIALVATALASLSYQLLEHPIRLSGVLDRHRAPVIAAGLALSAVSALVIIPTILEPTHTPAAALRTDPDDLTGLTPIPDGIDFDAIRSVPPPQDCRDRPATDCTVVTGSGQHVLLLGDSHAAMLIPTFEAIAVEHGLSLSVATRGGCPWQRGLLVSPVLVDAEVTDAAADASQRACEQTQDDVYDRIIPALQPDIVVVVSFAYETPGQFVLYLDPAGDPLPLDSPEFEERVSRATARSLDQLRAGGRKVLVVEPIPFAPGLDPLSCLSDAAVQEECRQVVPGAPTRVEALYRRLDRDDAQVWSVDVDQLVCPFLPICDPIVDGLVVKADANHVTMDFAKALAPNIEEYLSDNGILTL